LILEGKPVVKFKSNIKHFAALHSIRFNEQRLFISRKAACRAIASVTAGQDRKEKKKRIPIGKLNVFAPLREDSILSSINCDGGTQ
jgi:hypothetical protein